MSNRERKVELLKNSVVYKSLKNFDDFSQEFYMLNSLKPDWTDSLFQEAEKNEKISEDLIEFSHADGTGATFAIWVINEQNIEENPIVYIGETLKVVTKNLLDFLILLSLDSEFGDGVYRDCEDYEESPKHRVYCNWLKNTMNLKPIANCNDKNGDEYPEEAAKIYDEAQELYQLNLDTWFYNISSGENLSSLEYKEKFLQESDEDRIDSIDLEKKGSFELAEYYYLKNDKKKSFEYYKKAYEENSHNDKNYNNLAKLYEEEGDTENAFKFYVLSIIYSPSRCWGEDSRHDSLIKLCNSLKKDYINTCKEIVKKTDDSISHAVIMKSYFEEGLIEKAFDHFKLVYGDNCGFLRADEKYIYWKKQFGIAGMFSKKKDKVHCTPSKTKN